VLFGGALNVGPPGGTERRRGTVTRSGRPSRSGGTASFDVVSYGAQQSVVRHRQRHRSSGRPGYQVVQSAGSALGDDRLQRWHPVDLLPAATAGGTIISSGGTASAIVQFRQTTNPSRSNIGDGPPIGGADRTEQRPFCTMPVVPFDTNRQQRRLAGDAGPLCQHDGHDVSRAGQACFENCLRPLAGYFLRLPPVSYAPYQMLIDGGRTSTGVIDAAEIDVNERAAHVPQVPL